MPIPNVSHNGQSWHWAKLPTLPLWRLLTAQWFLCGNASTSTSESASASASASASTSSRQRDSDSVQVQNEIIPAMLLSFRGCSLMGAGLKSPSGRVRQQRLLNWLPLAANGSSTSRSFSLSRLLFIEIYCILNKIGTRYGIRDSTFSQKQRKQWTMHVEPESEIP